MEINSEMSAVKLSPQQNLDVKTQAKVVVTIAVAANLLLAVVLSVILFTKKAPHEAKSRETLRPPGTEHCELVQPDLAQLMPSPADW